MSLRRGRCEDGPAGPPFAVPVPAGDTAGGRGESSTQRPASYTPGSQHPSRRISRPTSSHPPPVRRRSGSGNAATRSAVS